MKELGTFATVRKNTLGCVPVSARLMEWNSCRLSEQVMPFRGRHVRPDLSLERAHHWPTECPSNTRQGPCQAQLSLLTQVLSPSFFLPWGPYVGWPHYLPHHRSDPWHHPAHFSPACHSLVPSSCLDSLCPVPSPPTHLMHHPTSSQALVSPTPISLHSPRTDPAPPLLTPSHGSLVSSETPNSVAWPQGFLPLNILLPSRECSPC